MGVVRDMLGVVMQMSVTTAIRQLILLISLGALCACATESEIQPGIVRTAPNPQFNQDRFVADAQSYVLRPNDIVSVTVFREPDLSAAEVGIDGGGSLSLPLLGHVDASGLTPAELERLLEREYGTRYLRDPKVSVNVVKYQSHQITVEGAVEEPGMYTFMPGTRLSGGVALAKGLKREADIEKIAVFRDEPTGMQVARFDLAAMRTGTMPDPVLQPGDRIVVGTDNLTQFWQDMLRALPVLGLFTRL